MQISANTVVGIEYTLKDDEGNVIDSSEGGDLLHYLHGHGNIVEGLEGALEGRAIGENLKVSVPPEKGYGVFEEGLVFEVPRERLPRDFDPVKGMQLGMTSDEGHTIPVTIKNVKLKSVTVDANHELAGKTLHFEVTVREVRKASAEELEHGHAHGPHGHHHH